MLGPPPVPWSSILEKVVMPAVEIGSGVRTKACTRAVIGASFGRPKAIGEPPTPPGPVGNTTLGTGMTGALEEGWTRSARPATVRILAWPAETCRRAGHTTHSPAESAAKKAPHGR